MQANLYFRNNANQRRDVSYVLDEHFGEVRWTSDGSDTAIDVGCGTGDVTCELLLPRVEGKCSRLLAVDASEDMIEFAASKWPGTKVEFRLMDLVENRPPEELEMAFDHVFSFYCLHWIQDQSKAMENLYRLIRPGGDMLLTFLARNPIYAIYESMAKTHKWRRYMYNYKKYVSPYHCLENPLKELRNLLLDSGFDVHTCEIVERSYTFPNFRVLKQAVKAVSPFLHKIPENLRDDYIDDYCAEVRKTKDVKVYSSDNNNDEQIFYKYDIFVVYASRND